MDKDEPSLENEELNTTEIFINSSLTHSVAPHENQKTVDPYEVTQEAKDYDRQSDNPEDGIIQEDASLVIGDQVNLNGNPPNPPKQKKQLLKILVLFICLLAIGAIGATQAPSASFVCQGCHEMKPEIVTWQASSHAKIACIQCHTEIDAGHFLQIKHFTKKYYLPIQVKEPVPESVCQNCHSLNRTVTPRGDLIVPHQKHEKEGISCTECHIGVAHGGIAERQETIDGDFNRWNDVTGRQNMSWQYKTLSMEQCLTCHKERKGPQDCEACHSRIVPPPSHQTKDWIQKGVHGQDAFKNLDSCNECHSYSLNLVRVQMDDKVGSYARSNSFCVDCHSKKPPSHNIKPFLHGGRASMDQRGCLVCHEKTTTKKANVATKTVCISCHKKQHSMPNFHPVPIQSGAGLIPSCYKCHSKNNCSKCHK